MILSCVNIGNIPDNSLTQAHPPIRSGSQAATFAIHHYKTRRKTADGETTPTTA